MSSSFRARAVGRRRDPPQRIRNRRGTQEGGFARRGLDIAGEDDGAATPEHPDDPPAPLDACACRRGSLGPGVNDLSRSTAPKPMQASSSGSGTPNIRIMRTGASSRRRKPALAETHRAEQPLSGAERSDPFPGTESNTHRRREARPRRNAPSRATPVRHRVEHPPAPRSPPSPKRTEQSNTPVRAPSEGDPFPGSTGSPRRPSSTPASATPRGLDSPPSTGPVRAISPRTSSPSCAACAGGSGTTPTVLTPLSVTLGDTRRYTGKWSTHPALPSAARDRLAFRTGWRCPSLRA